MASLALAGALFVPLMTLVVWLAPALRRAIEAWGGTHAASAEERQASAASVLADVEERRGRLAVNAGLVEEETFRETARLRAEAAAYDTDREAAGKVLGEAIEARRKVLEARADAEAALAPDAARAALEDSSEWLGAAYAAYCQSHGYADPLPLGQWVQGFAGPQGRTVSDE